MYEYLLNENTVELCDSLLRIMPSEAKPASLLAKIDLFIEQVRRVSVGKIFPYSVLKMKRRVGFDKYFSRYSDSSDLVGIL